MDKDTALKQDLAKADRVLARSRIQRNIVLAVLVTVVLGGISLLGFFDSYLVG